MTVPPATTTGVIRVLLKPWLILGLAIAVWGLSVGAGMALAGPVDLFAASNVTVSSFSPLNSLCTFTIFSLFQGGPTGNCGSTEKGAKEVIFADGNPAGFQNVVNFSTNSPVTLGSVRLFGLGDGPSAGNQRDIGRFIFSFESSPTVQTTLIDFTPSHPESVVPSTCKVVPDPTCLILDTSVSPVTAQNFRAVFTNFSDHISNGPRVIELDGFAAVPEPGTVELLAAGLAGAGFFRRRRIWTSG